MLRSVARANVAESSAIHRTLRGVERTASTRAGIIPAPAMSLTTGTRIGPYEILAKVGEGGMGEVFRARDTRLGRDVAIKILPSLFSADADRLRRFEQEARAAAALNHPNVLVVYDVGDAGGVAYVVSELLDGQTLRQ